MADIRPFKAIRPDKEFAGRVAALPYDVYNRKEAKIAAHRDPLSFLNIDRPETQFVDGFDMYDRQVYLKAKEMLGDEIRDGVFIKDETSCYYIYELSADGHCQTGIVAVSSVDDYLGNVIKRHENIFKEKEIDRINHITFCGAQTGPIFLAYRSRQEINDIVDREKKSDPVYDFTADDGVTHRVWVVDGPDEIAAIREQFLAVESIYIADGHHRAASAVDVALTKRSEDPDFDRDAEFNFFLSVLFPDDQLQIIDYNRVVRDLNRLSSDAFLDMISVKFEISRMDERAKPKEKGTIGMFLDDKWYLLTAKDFIRSDDPVKGLDVSILQDNILSPILGIHDPKNDKRISFVGGIRGLCELERRCRTDMRVAFAMHPTTIGELFAVSDAGLLMPPKSTWFEPKLRSGIFIHRID